MGLLYRIERTIEALKQSGINGCITGSSMIPEADFDTWESEPDVDVFIYSESSFVWAISRLATLGFKPLNDGEEWKLKRIEMYGIQRKAPLTTIKLVSDDNIIINLTYKKNKTNIFEVLSSFDMSIIMIGYDIQKQVCIDLRCAWPGLIRDDTHQRWSTDCKVAVPNPLRNQDTDMYTVAQWVRQFDRVIKYWNRGYDTRPMAKFYIDSIDSVINQGALFATDKSQAAYTEFVETYEPLRDKMAEWLYDKEDC